MLRSVVSRWFVAPTLFKIGLPLLALVVAASAFAHDPGLSTAEGRVGPDGLTLVIAFAPADAHLLLPPSGAKDEAAWQKVAGDLVAAHLADGSALMPSSVRADRAGKDAVKFEYFFALSSTSAVQVVVRGLERLPPAHRQFAVIQDEQGNVLAKKFLTATDAVLAFAPGVGGSAAGEAAPAKTSWRSFIWLGVEHIWTGYDHLLFLLALLIVCRTFRSILAIISCFTLAHSVTLALATFDVVNLPSRVVEPAIAASIVFVAVENLIRRGGEPKGRWALTFAFGLIHGFGFASVLRELGVGGMAGGAAVPLFAFNVGVELGQIAVAGVTLPIVWWLRRRDAFLRWGVPVLSGVVAAAGLYWFVERVFWS